MTVETIVTVVTVVTVVKVVTVVTKVTFFFSTNKFFQQQKIHTRKITQDAFKAAICNLAMFIIKVMCPITLLFNFY